MLLQQDMSVYIRNSVRLNLCDRLGDMTRPINVSRGALGELFIISLCVHHDARVLTPDFVDKITEFKIKS